MTNWTEVGAAPHGSVLRDKNGNVPSHCPTCKRTSTFIWRDAATSSYHREFGYITVDEPHVYGGHNFGRVIFRMFACVVCLHPGVLKTHANNSDLEGTTEWFWPTGIYTADLPIDTPADLRAEFEEAEKCAAAAAWRGAAALLRSTLEKTLKANGYTERNLFENIELARKDGLITATRARSAHDIVRTLGNDVLHDAWREVGREEVLSSALFVQRILEDFYFNRSSAEAALTENKRPFERRT